jgi:hypothetical protein
VLGGVSPGRSTDDSVVGSAGVGDRLGRGAEWTPVGDWQAVAEAVREVGPGGMALGMARTPVGPGHVVVAYHPRPTGNAEHDGPVWVEVSREDGVRILDAPDAVPLEARALVVDPAGRAVEGALDPHRASGSTAHALVDRATDPRYGMRRFAVAAGRRLFGRRGAPAELTDHDISFVNVNSRSRGHVEKARTILGLLARHPEISAYRNRRPAAITLRRRFAETPADVHDRGADVQINLASYYFEEYSIGYVVGMLAHEFAIHPLGDTRQAVRDYEKGKAAYRFAVPGVPGATLVPNRARSSVDHPFGAAPESPRYQAYRDVVLSFATLLFDDALRAGGAGMEYIPDLLDCFLMDVASIAATNDNRLLGMPPRFGSGEVRERIAASYNDYLARISADIDERDPRLGPFLPPPKTAGHVLTDYTTLARHAFEGLVTGPSMSHEPSEPPPVPAYAVANRSPYAAVDWERAKDPGLDGRLMEHLGLLSVRPDFEELTTRADAILAGHHLDPPAGSGGTALEIDYADLHTKMRYDVAATIARHGEDAARQRSLELRDTLGTGRPEEPSDPEPTDGPVPRYPVVDPEMVAGLGIDAKSGAQRALVDGHRERDQALALTREIMSGDHQDIPIERDTPEAVAYAGLYEKMTYSVAAAVLEHGEEIGRETSRMFRDLLGTRRRGGLPGAGPLRTPTPEEHETPDPSQVAGPSGLGRAAAPHTGPYADPWRTDPHRAPYADPWRPDPYTGTGPGAAPWSPGPHPEPYRLAGASGEQVGVVSTAPPRRWEDGTVPDAVLKSSREGRGRFDLSRLGDVLRRPRDGRRGGRDESGGEEVPRIPDPLPTYRGLRLLPIERPDGTRIGVASFNRAEWPSHLATDMLLGDLLHVLDIERRAQPGPDGEMATRSFVLGRRPVPWGRVGIEGSGPVPFFYSAHGWFQGITAVQDSDEATVMLDNDASADLLAHLTRDVEPDRPIVLVSCYVALPSGSADPLFQIPVAQSIANRTGRRVFASMSQMGATADGIHMIRSAPNRPNLLTEFRPEPPEATVAEWVRASGNASRDGEVRAPGIVYGTRVLRLLKAVLGTDIEDDRQFQPLFNGVTRLDTLRRDTEFRNGLLDRATLRRLTAHMFGLPEAEVTPALQRKLLFFVQGLHGNDPDREFEQLTEKLREHYRTKLAPQTGPPPQPTLSTADSVYAGLSGEQQ